MGHYLGCKNTFNANRSLLQVWGRFCIIPGTYFTWLNLYRSLQRQILWFFPFYKWGNEAKRDKVTCSAKVTLLGLDFWLATVTPLSSLDQDPNGSVVNFWYMGVNLLMITMQMESLHRGRWLKSAHCYVSKNFFLIYPCLWRNFTDFPFSVPLNLIWNKPNFYCVGSQSGRVACLFDIFFKLAIFENCQPRCGRTPRAGVGYTDSSGLLGRDCGEEKCLVEFLHYLMN